MSSLTKYDSELNKSKRQAREELNKKKLAVAKNHVSFEDKSRGGQPFHFKGPRRQK